MRNVALIAFSQSDKGDVEALRDVVARALDEAELQREQVGFYCSGSSDFVTGLPFSFVHALDAIGAWPPISESHVEMDGAWALYEAWVRLQHGAIDSAVVYAFGRATAGSVADVLGLQLDPYYVAPLKIDAISLAALQARIGLDRNTYTAAD